MSLPKEMAEILRESVELVRTVQPMLEKQAEFNAECTGRAEAVVDALITAGLIPLEKRSEQITELQDPFRAYEYIEKLAKRVGPDNLGVTDEKSGSETDDPAEALKNWIIND